MKRYIKASSSPAQTLHKLVDYMNEEGIDEHTMLEFFFDSMDSEKCIEMMKTLSDECDLDLSEFWESLV